MPTKIGKGCINLVKGFEGYHKKLPNGDCTTYYCPAGVLTIGYGTTTDIKEGDVWTPGQAVDALKRDLDTFAEQVSGLVKVELNQNQFDALVSFAYNVGAGALAKSTLLKKLNKGDFDGAVAQFKNWTRGGGKVLPGLVRRRAVEAELFVTPPGPAEPVMPQAVDAPTPVAAAVKGSRTIFGLLGTLAGFVAYVFNETIALLMAAAAQMDVFAPIARVFSGLGVTTASIAVVMVLAGIAWALFAKLDDARKGNVTK